jgi:hypothetical protein
MQFVVNYNCFLRQGLVMYHGLHLTCYVDQAGLEFTIFLPDRLIVEISGVYPQVQLCDSLKHLNLLSYF